MLLHKIFSKGTKPTLSMKSSSIVILPSYCTFPPVTLARWIFDLSMCTSIIPPPLNVPEANTKSLKRPIQHDVGYLRGVVFVFCTTALLFGFRCSCYEGYARRMP